MPRRRTRISLPRTGSGLTSPTRAPGPSPLILAIAGGSGSGKSWLADRLERVFRPHVVRLSLDDFYHDRSHLPESRRARVNFDHPRAIDWKGLQKVLRSLLADRIAQAPCYDFKSHSRLKTSKTLRPKPILLIEGLWVLHRPSIRRLISLSVFLRCSARTRLHRRLARDLSTRGRTADSVRRQFRQSVQPMHRRFVEPQRKLADFVFEKDCGPAEIDLISARLKGLL